ncbi:PIN domain-containing protein [Geminocystis herdmanii]|uniref:PIN domain-containing protein n=1 Tax=Geminocystis herdmanii TaxID=669359 RepID=UPI0003470B73|nr:PIN domain-containing protein [Geminocystis herdmanii]
MSNPLEPIIIDTNILFSALLNSKSNFAFILLLGNNEFYISELVLVELFKYQNKILKLSKLSEEEVIQFYHIILKRINVYKEDLIHTNNLKLAYNLCKDIDVHDTVHVALTSELQGKLWTGDNKLKQGLLKKGFNFFFQPEKID